MGKIQTTPWPTKVATRFMAVHLAKVANSFSSNNRVSPVEEAVGGSSSSRPVEIRLEAFLALARRASNLDRFHSLISCCVSSLLSRIDTPVCFQGPMFGTSLLASAVPGFSPMLLRSPWLRAHLAVSLNTTSLARFQADIFRFVVCWPRCEATCSITLTDFCACQIGNSTGRVLYKLP
jgi:hypothetical protein